MASTLPKLKSGPTRAEKRAEHDKQWAEKRLKSIGKGGALDNLRTNWHSYTPFEMNLLLASEGASAAVETRITRVARVFESLRNMIIILPLMLTWLSLAVAGAAYQQSLTAKPPNAEPFLQQWQEGFTTLISVAIWNWKIPLVVNHIRWFTFSSFALTDAALLALLLLFTIMGQLLEIWGYQRGVRLAAYLDRYTYDYSLKALGQGLANAPDEKMPPWLRELRTDLGRLGDIIQKMNGVLDESMESYSDALLQQEKAVKALMEDTDKVHDSVVQLKDLFQGGAEAARIYQKYIPHVSNDFASMVDAQRRTAKEFQGMAAMLKDSAISLARLAGRLRDSQSTLNRYSQPPSSSYAQQSEPLLPWQRRDSQPYYQQPPTTMNRPSYGPATDPYEAIAQVDNAAAGLPDPEPIGNDLSWDSYPEVERHRGLIGKVRGVFGRRQR